MKKVFFIRKKKLIKLSVTVNIYYFRMAFALSFVTEVADV